MAVISRSNISPTIHQPSFVGKLFRAVFVPGLANNHTELVNDQSEYETVLTIYQKNAAFSETFANTKQPNCTSQFRTSRCGRQRPHLSSTMASHANPRYLPYLCARTQPLTALYYIKRGEAPLCQRSLDIKDKDQVNQDQYV